MSLVERENWFVIRGPNARATRRTTSVTEEGEEERRKDSLYGEKCNLDVRKHFFTARVVETWNALPDSIRNQKSVNAFKNAYDQYRLNEKNKIKQLR